MSSLILWIDTQHAKMFFLSPEGTVRKEMHAHGPKHHSETQGRNHTYKESDEKRFFNEVAEALAKTDAVDWYVVGPGMGRTHFLKHLADHHSHLDRRVLGTDKMDKANDAEILEKGHAFFHRERLFQGPR